MGGWGFRGGGWRLAKRWVFGCKFNQRGSARNPVTARSRHANTHMTRRKNPQTASNTKKKGEKTKTCSKNETFLMLQEMKQVQTLTERKSSHSREGRPSPDGNVSLTSALFLSALVSSPAIRARSKTPRFISDVSVLPRRSDNRGREEHAGVKNELLKYFKSLETLNWEQKGSEDVTHLYFMLFTSLIIIKMMH